MILIRRVLPRRPGAAALSCMLPLTLLALAACSTNYSLPLSPSLGVGVNVAVSVPSGSTQIAQGEAVQIDATVADDVNNAGVTWSLLPGEPGSLTGATNTQVTYVAPASGVTGAVSAQVTATSVANAADTDTVTIVTMGTPVLNQSVRFPANVGVPYETDLSVSGGLAPFAWTLTSGALPPGLSLSNGVTAITSISGTPTTAGTYNFEVEMSDSNGSISGPLPVTLVVNPQAACLLSGQYTLEFSGFRGGAATQVANITIDSNGGITGEQDYKNGQRVTVDESLDPSSKCTNRSTNSGTLVLSAPSGQIQYNFSATPPDANNVIHSARLQLINSGSDSGSGQLTLTDPAALTGTPPSGNFAFGLLGVDGNGTHYGTAGSFSADSGGNISAGLVDSNGGTAAPLGAGVTDAAATGALSAPDAYGRGTLTLRVGSSTTTLAYYIVNASKLFVMNIDPTPGSGRASGFLTLQTGDATATTFDNAALASPSILSLWGHLGAIDPAGVVSLGRLSGADPTAGTINLVLDSANQAIDTSNASYPAQSYTVGSSGRGTLTLTGSSGTRSFVFYLDGTADGYILEQNSPSGNAGLLEAQTVPSGGFPDTLAGDFVGGTQFPQTPGPVSLLPLMYVAYGTVSSNYYNGTFAIDPNSGRGFGTVQQQQVATTADVLYEVSPTKLDVMNFATPGGTAGTIIWLVQ